MISFVVVVAAVLMEVLYRRASIMVWNSYERCLTWEGRRRWPAISMCVWRTRRYEDVNSLCLQLPSCIKQIPMRAWAYAFTHSTHSLTHTHVSTYTYTHTTHLQVAYGERARHRTLLPGVVHQHRAQILRLLAVIINKVVSVQQHSSKSRSRDPNIVTAYT